MVLPQYKCKWCGRTMIVKTTSQHPVSCPDCATITEATGTFSNLLERGGQQQGAEVAGNIAKYKAKRKGAFAKAHRTLRKLVVRK